MTLPAKIVVLGGDGVGPEVTNEAVKVLGQIFTQSVVVVEFDHHLIGGAAMDATGTPLPENTLEACKSATAILLGAVGGPKWDALGAKTGIRPEQGLLALRKNLNLYANIRPCIFPAKSLLNKSPLKQEIVEGVSFIVVRELTGGVYFGDRVEGGQVATDTMSYSVEEIQRITRIAANISLQSTPPLPITSIDKANVLATSRLWRKVVTETIQKEFPSLESHLSHNLVDSAAMIMVKTPRKLNGIVLTENMFGDILSDEASVIPGSLGLLPSASLSGWGGKSVGVFEPIHGSAPDIAGKGVCNPVGAILSAAMLLRYSMDMDKEAKMIEDAVEQVIDEQGIITPDLGGSASTSQVGDAIVAAIKMMSK